MTTTTPSTTDLTDEVRTWPGAALVIDPHGRLFEATAADRERHGPVYRMPDEGIDVATLFDLAAAPDVQALHGALLGYAQDQEPTFSRHSVPLLQAATACAQATAEHPLRVLARWADMAAPRALREAQQFAPAAVRQFTRSGDPNLDDLERFTLAAWSTFVTHLGPMVPHLALLTRADIPANWHQCVATIYVTLPLDSHINSLVTCIVEGCLRAVQRQPVQPPVLLVLDDGVPPLHLTVDHTQRAHAAAGSTIAMVPSLALARTVVANGHTRLILSTDTSAQTDTGRASTARTGGRFT